MGLCVFSLNSVDILLKKLYRFSFLTNALLLFVAVMTFLIISNVISSKKDKEAAR